MAALRAVTRPLPSRTVLLVCDVQERFRPLIHEFGSVVQVAGTLARVASALQIPTVVTEQYPKALGHTVAELAPHLAGAGVFSKLKFSMMTDEVDAHLAAAAPGFTDAIIVGIETHVCVQQTAMDLLAAGKRPWVVVDGASSQRPHDRSAALAFLRSAGAQLTTTESMIMMLLGGADHEAFKPVQRLLIEHNKVGSALPPA